MSSANLCINPLPIQPRDRYAIPVNLHSEPRQNLFLLLLSLHHLDRRSRRRRVPEPILVLFTFHSASFLLNGCRISDARRDWVGPESFLGLAPMAGMGVAGNRRRTRGRRGEKSGEERYNSDSENSVYITKAGLLEKGRYPYSLLRPLAFAFAAFPPPYFLLKSSFIRSKKPMGKTAILNQITDTQSNSKNKWKRGNQKLTETVIGEVIEGVTIAIVGEPIVGRGKFLEALGGNGGEIAGQLRVLREDHRSPGHKAVDQQLVSGSGVGSSEVGLSLPTIAVLETWTVANWQNGKWLGNYYLLLPFCNLPVWTVGTWNYEARTNG
nr:hypothetical protein GW17_00027190 [Ipomoea batatas]